MAFSEFYLLELPEPGDRDIHRGIQNINKNNYKNALRHFVKASTYDNEYGALFVAILYFTGFGVEKRNPSKALDLFKDISLKWNSPAAQYLIGCMYFEGDEGIPQNGESGIYWLSLASDNGWSSAMALLGKAYHDGTFTKEDRKKAISWYKKVAEKDESEIESIKDDPLYLFENKNFELRFALNNQESLATMFLDSNNNAASPVLCCKLSVSSSLKKFRYMYIWDSLTNKKSASVSFCQLHLAYIYCNNNSNALIDNIESIYWAKAAAKNRNSTACLFIGTAYGGNENGRPDHNEEFKWYKKAYDLEKKNGNIAYFIGRSYYSGRGVEKNRKLALHYFQQATNNSCKYPESYFLMGQIYQLGKDGIPKDYKKAYNNYLKAFDLGFSKAGTGIGIIYRDGLGVNKDDNLAYDWFVQAAFLGCPIAQYLLGIIHFNGYKGRVDLDKALHFFEQSHTGKFEAAKYMMEQVKILREK